MSCSICKKYFGKSVLHPNNECPQASSVTCRRCHCRGHMASECTELWPQYERPTTYEELIPAYLRARYNITTHTTLPFRTPRSLPETSEELADIAMIEVPEEYTLMKEFIDHHRIKVEKITKESITKCREAVMAWGVTHGYRIAFVPSRA